MVVGNLPSIRYLRVLPFWVIFDAYAPLDPAVYPHLIIYPPIAGVSKPPPQSPAPPTLNSTNTSGIRLASGYPSLVICKHSDYRWSLGAHP